MVSCKAGRAETAPGWDSHSLCDLNAQITTASTCLCKCRACHKILGCPWGITTCLCDISLFLPFFSVLLNLTGFPRQELY